MLASEGVRGHAELSVLFVGEDDIAALNSQFLGKDEPTDVLAFPIDASEVEVVSLPAIARTGPDRSPADPGELPLLLGDVVICPAVAARQATAHAGRVDDELALLVVHGVLHVLGHDHAEPGEAARMRARERELLETHHWGGPAPAGFRQEQDVMVYASQFGGPEVAMILVIILLLLLLMFLAVAETAINRISRVKAQAIEEERSTKSSRALLRLASSARGVHQPDPGDHHGLPDGPGLPHLTPRRTSLRRLGRDLHRLRAQRDPRVRRSPRPSRRPGRCSPPSERRCSPPARRSALVRFPPLRLVAEGLIGMANVLLPGKGLKQGPFVSERELLGIVEAAAEDEVIEHEERELIESIIELGDTVAREIMVPRPDMVTVAAETQITDALDIAIEHGFSRLPIIGESVDDVRRRRLHQGPDAGRAGGPRTTAGHHRRSRRRGSCPRRSRWPG